MDTTPSKEGFGSAQICLEAGPSCEKLGWAGHAEVSDTGRHKSRQEGGRCEGIPGKIDPFRHASVLQCVGLKGPSGEPLEVHCRPFNSSGASGRRADMDLVLMMRLSCSFIH